jgi:hypothetical protein
VRFKQLLPLFLLLLVSCSSVPTKVRIDELINTESVTNESIKKGGINFIGSTTDSYSNIDSKQVVTLNENVKSLFISKYKTNTDLNNLPRYNLTYTILSNSTFQSKYSSAEETCFKTFREMKVQLYIMESKTKEKVWGGSINKHLYNKNCSPKSESNSESLAGIFFESLIGAVIDVAVESVLGTYPKAPSVTLISNKIFNDFINSLHTMNSEES